MTNSQAIQSIPLVRRLEYIDDFLRGVSTGGIQSVEERLVARKKSFEAEKSRAVGRGRPFMKKLEKAGRLTELCRAMATQLGLIERGKTIVPSNLGNKYLLLNEQDRLKFLAERMLQTYSRFRQLLRCLTLQGQLEIEVPMAEKGSRKTPKFQLAMETIGLPNFSIIYFETIVDLGTQLGLINWHSSGEGASRSWTVYLTSRVEIDRRPADLADWITVEIGKETWSVGLNTVRADTFRDQLWKEYLNLTKYIARKPVFYSMLRARVCYRLRIGDMLFDTYAQQIMQHDQDFVLVGAGGTLPFTKDSASLSKSLPPRTDRGEYIVYLKMDKRRVN